MSSGTDKNWTLAAGVDTEVCAPGGGGSRGAPGAVGAGKVLQLNVEWNEVVDK